MRKFEGEYRIKGWTLADAFHPNPGRGRGYLKGQDNNENSDADLVEQARKAVPANYDLWSVAVISPDRRDVWRRNIDGTEVYLSEATEISP